MARAEYRAPQRLPIPPKLPGRQLIKFVVAGFSGGEQALVPERGARTQTMCAVMPDAQFVSGAYYADCATAQEVMCVNNVDDTKGLCGHGDNVAPIISTASAVNLASHAGSR